ncbi:proline-rich receptor-like protein kinase PERK5 [Sesamum indicum]|uniref:non-specific serine/threonine protein kinase n=1 Tax=Sesamum indicum TaxID=4182 RepID=A0A6I9UNY7_SESIN|nr:proline-rich receptor-like protein kinase PERK5 [Sesamum indicum]
MDHVVKVGQSPALMAGSTPGGGWGAPLPPHMAHNNNEFSPNHMHMQTPSPMGGYGAKSEFTFEELAAATSGFSQHNLLGQGGFGLVHKGILASGKEVAIKSLKTGSGQGEREFQAEVEIISRVHHRHLVSLVGYCIAGTQRMLVYEFVPNQTLEFHLHGKGRPVMDWGSRLRIALGSAKGLAYLHEDCHPRIIHRDIKAANILLDFNFEAMVADFGLAKLTTDNYTHVSTRIMGTFGYLAPEYAASGKLTEKSDVFSFGVMLLELITGRRPVDPTNRTMEDSLVDWARPVITKAMEDGNYSKLVDPRLEDNYVPQEMARMVACASASIRHSARRRPRMSQIVRALEGDSSLEDLNEGGKAGQNALASSTSNVTKSNITHEIYDTGAYNADMMRFRQMIMPSQEYNSSEYGATSEYGLNPSSSSGETTPNKKL